jgi:UDP-2,3-diacylglucosamine pyrophosphatase LpxH
MLDAVILSDLHLGSDNCQAKSVCHLLERLVDGELHAARLILNGDVFDSIDFRRLHKSHWKVLSLIRKLSDRVETIWLCGNHDGSAEVVSHLLGVSVMDDYVLESGSERILVLHGHVFDDFIDRYPVTTWFADVLYGFLQWIDRTHSIAKMAKHGSKTFLRCAKKIEEGAIALARRKGCTAVCCGHTHAPAANTDQAIAYHNGGCWTELPCTYLTVEDGVVSLHVYGEEAVQAPDATAEATPLVASLESV